MDAAVIADRFGLGGRARLSEGPVARGKQGQVFRLDTTEGRWAVKVPFRPGTEASVEPSTRFQEAALDHGVRVPEVRRTTEGRVLAEVDGTQVRVHAWVDLLPPDPHLDPARVGDLVARLHQVPIDDVGPEDAWYVAPVGAAAWDDLVVRLTAAQAPFAARLAGLRDELVALEAWIEPTEAVRPCHRDLWADNVLSTAEGDLCVLDWENCGDADPSHELGCVVFEYARSDRGRVRALLDAYRQAGGPGVLTRPGHFSMLIAQLGHVTHIAAEDWLEPSPRSPDRAESAAWVAEALEDLHTRRVLTRLLGR